MNTHDMGDENESSTQPVKGIKRCHSDDQVTSVDHLSKVCVPAVIHDNQPAELSQSTSKSVLPVGGTVSTSTAHATKQTTGEEALELVKAFIRKGEETAYNATVETRGASLTDTTQVHVHLEQTNIHNPSAITLGGQVVVNPPEPKKKEPRKSRNPTELQKLRCATERKIDKWTEGMIKTMATQAVLDKISQDITWITITGSPGEGKTTAGYLVLKHLNSMGRQVFDIQTPKEYFRVKHTKQPVIMLNDIFGFLHFDRKRIGKWEKVLADVLAMTEHIGEEKQLRVKTKCRPTVILISRSTVLKEASHHLGRFRGLILNDNNVVDFTSGMKFELDERVKIWKYHCDRYDINIDERVMKEVCKMPLPHGFPHCCRLFAAMYSKDKHLCLKSFFSKPLEFLNQTLESLMVDSVTGPLLREMLRGDGSLDLDSITDDEKRFQYTSAVDVLNGSYLSQEATTVTFHHPSVYDSAAFVLCKKDPLFVVRSCTLSFLNERVRFDSLDYGIEIENQPTVRIDEKYISTVLGRLQTEFSEGNLSETLAHMSFHDEGFVSKFMEMIAVSLDSQVKSKAIRNIILQRDKLTNHSFLFLMTRSGSDKIFRYVSQYASLSQEELTETLFGICENASLSGMKYFLMKFGNFNFNVENESNQTPLMLSATKCSEKVLKLFTDIDLDVNKTDNNGETALHNVCRHGVGGDGDVVKMLIQKGADMNIVSSKWPFTPLHIACREGHRNVVTTLLQCGADIDKRDTYGYTPLVHACLARHMDVVTMLIDKGADVGKIASSNETTLDIALRLEYKDILEVILEKRASVLGETPLTLACCHGHTDFVTFLLNRGADVDVTDKDSNTPLTGACRNGHIDIIKLLLDKGADINMPDKDGNRPLTLACCSGHMDIVTLLLDRGADVSKSNSDITRLFTAACSSGITKLVMLLLSKGIDVNESDNNGNTPLVSACQSGHKDIVQLLLDRGADVNKSATHGNTPLTASCYGGNIDIVTVLIDRRANVNMADTHGNTPLTGACYSGHMDVVTLLLDRGADVNMSNNNGNTPLAEASYNGHMDVVTNLLNRGADVNKSGNDGNTPLQRACSNGNMDIMTLLLDKGADINKTDCDGNTHLHIACYRGYVKIAKMLLSKGANVNKANKYNGTSLHVACFWGEVEVVKLLLDSGADVHVTNTRDDTPLHESYYRGCGNVACLLLEKGADVSKANRYGSTCVNFWKRNEGIKAMNG